MKPVFYLFSAMFALTTNAEVVDLSGTYDKSRGNVKCTYSEKADPMDLIYIPCSSGESSFQAVSGHDVGTIKIGKVEGDRLVVDVGTQFWPSYCFIDQGEDSSKTRFSSFNVDSIVTKGYVEISSQPTNGDFSSDTIKSRVRFNKEADGSLRVTAEMANYNFLGIRMRKREVSCVFPRL